METIKDILNFCNEALFYDYEIGAITEELNDLRRCIISNFQNNVPPNRICIALSEIDEMILKIINNDTEDILKHISKLRNNIIYMISFNKTVEDSESDIDE